MTDVALPSGLILPRPKLELPRIVVPRPVLRRPLRRWWKDRPLDGAIVWAAPTLSSQAGSNFTDTATTETTGAITWSTGSYVLVLGMTENNTDTLNTPTVSGLTFSLILSTNTATTCKGYAWHATAASGGSGTIAATGSAGAAMKGLFAFVYDGSGGLGNTASIASGTADTISLIRGSDNSAVAWIGGDFGATNDVTVSPDPAGGTQRVAARLASSATMFCFDWADQGAAATTPYGIGGFTTASVFTKIAIEIKGTAAAPKSPPPARRRFPRALLIR